MKKIIYIDDMVGTEAMDSRLELIADCGFEIIQVDSVETSMDAIAAYIDQISLIVIDIIMPPLDKYTLEETNGGTTTGLRLLKDIRAKYPKIPIVIVSIKQRNNLEGIDEILSKYKVAAFFERQKSTATDIGEAIKKILST